MEERIDRARRQRLRRDGQTSLLQALRRDQCATDRTLGGRRRLQREIGGDRRAETARVERRSDAADDGDPERGPE